MKQAVHIVTVFAPTNDAFAKIPKATLDKVQAPRRFQLVRSDQPAGRSPGATEMTESSSVPTYSKKVIFANSGTT